MQNLKITNEENFETIARVIITLDIRDHSQLGGNFYVVRNDNNVVFVGMFRQWHWQQYKPSLMT